MDNDIIDQNMTNNISSILWNITPPCSYEEFLEIASAFKYFYGYPETFFKWCESVSNFSMQKSDWDKIPLRLTDNMEKIFKTAHLIGQEISRVVHLSIDFPFDVDRADQLPEKFDAPDEIVEGILTSGDGSILYGDSNSGKTFFVIDMACALARGALWLDRRTEKGMVVYLAAESPSSVKRRLQAYQQHFKLKVPNFFIVNNPINLFNGDEDTNKIIQLINLLERQNGDKVRLVIGDTLARLSSGANENAGTDMGVVVKHFDKIRNECKTHFLLIHHSGKSAAKGARGWSGVRAAVDTEIEITDNGSIKCAEITKQRDLTTKGLRIGFKTLPVVIGETKWKEPATSCVIIGTDPPKKVPAKKQSEITGALVEYFLTNTGLIRRGEIVKHFNGRHSRSGVYGAIDSLITKGQLKEENGFLLYNS